MKRAIIAIILVFVLNIVCYSQWYPIGPYGGNIMTIASSGNNVALSTYGCGVFTSSNNGNTWVSSIISPTSLSTYSLIYSLNNLFAGTNKGIFKSSNNGLNWVQHSLINKIVLSILINNNFMYAGTNDSGIYISSNNGITWVQSNSGLSYKRVNVIILCTPYVFIGTNGGVYRSGDNGASWIRKIWGLGADPINISILASIGSNIFTYYYRSTDFGDHWYKITYGLLDSSYVLSLGTDGNNLFGGTTGSGGDYNKGLYISTNSGNLWSNLDNGQISGVITGISVSGQNIFTSTEIEYINPSVTGGVFRSTNYGLNWVNINNGIYNLNTLPIVNVGSFLFTGYNGIYVSSNSGTNWNKINSPSLNRRINVLASSGSNLYAGTEDSCIIVSNNYGENWTHLGSNNISNHTNVSVLGVSGSNIFAGIEYGDLYISSNNGNTWRVIDTANLHVRDVRDIIISGTNVFAGFNSGGICRSTNNGLNWVRVNNGLTSPYYYLTGLAKDGQNLYACFYWGTGIFMSTNNGDNWVKISNEISNWNFTTIAAYDSKIFVGADSVIFYSSNFGTNWNRINQGLPDYNFQPLIKKLYIFNGYIYATTNYKSVWRRLLSNFVGIHNISTEILSKYSLSQNYPNPFNPVTKIKFEFPLSKGGLKGVVSLKVYDILGKEVTTLVNESLQPGTYEVTFDGSNLPSGIYFYKLTSGKYSESRKLVLLK
jgi:photosystem II stability/assembly factor-like uncharacterized protein